MLNRAVNDHGIAAFAVLSAKGNHLGARLIGLVGNDRLVIGIVKRGADVVGHAAVNRHDLADVRQRFQDACRVQRDAGVSHQATAGLHQKARLGKTVLCAQLFHRRSGDLGEVGDAGRLVLGHIGNAQAAAHVEHLGLEAVRFLHARDELDHDLNGLTERM